MVHKAVEEAPVNPADIKVVVMEDHSKLCDVLRRAISVASGMQCIGHFCSGHETLKAMPELRPDVVSLDLSMPDLNGLGVLRRILDDYPKTRCIVFSGHTDEIYVRQAFESGALAYIYKEDVGAFIESIRMVAAGERYLSPRLQDLISDIPGIR